MTAALTIERQDVAFARRQVIQQATSLKPVKSFTQEQASQVAQLASSFPADKAAVQRMLVNQQHLLVANLRELGYGDAANRAEDALRASAPTSRESGAREA